MKRIYLDYAAATPVLPESWQAAGEVAQLYGNPGSIHADGVLASRALQKAREEIAMHLACKAREIIFTSGGTEANNLAILGFARAVEEDSSLAGTHWIVSAIEHPSVLECFGEVERLGGTVTFVDPDARGIIAPDAIARALRRETVFVSIGWGNGEIGVVQPLSEIARVVRDYEAAQKPDAEHFSVENKRSFLRSASSIIIHADAGQAPLYRGTAVHTLDVDLLTLDSAKLYGPRSIGALYIGKRTELKSIMLGGGQERGLRPGTENVALAAGFAKAFEIIAQERDDEAGRLREMRDDLAREIIARFPGVIINTDLKHALPHILNISLPGINSEYVTLALDHAGIAISTKSACREGEASMSHVVCALSAAVEDSSKEEWRARNTLRFSFGRSTEPDDWRIALAALEKAVLRV